MSESSPSGFTRRQIIRGAAVAGATASVIRPTAARADRENEQLPQVPRRMLGKTKETVPILLMGGSMRFDPRFDPKLAECLRFGVNYFDVADCYAGGTSKTGSSP